MARCSRSKRLSSLDAPVERGIIIETGGPAPMRIAAAMVVNAAGLGAQALARSIAGMPVEKIPPLHLAKGNYFSLSGRSPFSRLIYPMPTPGGLGVHLTLDLAGQAKFGPDVEWIDAIDYAVDPGRAIPSTPRSEPIGQTCRMARCSQVTPASGRRSRGLAARIRISCCRPKRITGSQGWSTCSGSSRRG